MLVTTGSLHGRRIATKVRSAVIPAYKSVKSGADHNGAKRLEQWGFLKRRPVKHMKEKFFWVMNPEFLQKYQTQLVQVFGS